MIVAQFPPPSVEYSTLTLAIDPVLPHVIFCNEPTIQVSPPLGEVIVIIGPELIENTELLTSLTAAVEVSLTRIKQVAEGVFGIVQA